MSLILLILLIVLLVGAIVWTSPVASVTHNRTGRPLEAVEAR